jgi:hypothetical protein
VDKIASFEKSYQKDVEELTRLQAKWETIVGEIWKTGLSCLGEEAMAQLFLVSQDVLPTAEEEDSLFVPEHSPRNGKKRVTFAEPAPELPDFLLGSSRLKPIPHLPELPKDAIKSLQDTVINLGSEHIAELKNMEDDEQKKWKKQMGSVIQALKDD